MPTNLFNHLPNIEKFLFQIDFKSSFEFNKFDKRICIRNMQQKEGNFSNLISLETLNLNHNRLKRIGENIFSDLKNLKKLNSSDNRLERLEANSFDGLENLIELDLSINKLEKIDRDAFSGLISLKTLDLNRITID